MLPLKIASLHHCMYIKGKLKVWKGVGKSMDPNKRSKNPKISLTFPKTEVSET